MELTSMELTSMENASNKFFDSGRMRGSRSLEELYSREGFKFAVIYGRRRVGKTCLIDEFINHGDKRSIFFGERSKKEQQTCANRNK
jgi:AAA+ ATPase superfamily predicted ATPase